MLDYFEETELILVRAQPSEGVTWQELAIHKVSAAAASPTYSLSSCFKAHSITQLPWRKYLCVDEYNIADIANYAWYGSVVLNNIYDAAVFLDAKSYTNLVRWASEIEKRPAVQRGQRVNKAWGPEEERVPERHAASDIK